MASSLELVHSKNDLPPSWDGRKVTWDEWSNIRTSLAYHLKPEEMACDQCGAVDESLIAWGLRDPTPGATMSQTQTKTTRSGKKYAIAVEAPACPMRDLYAARCRHCGHDVVTDTETDERWDLDETDYGPQGSTSDTLF